MLKTVLVVLSAVVALAWAQGGIPVSCFPDETKILFIQ